MTENTDSKPTAELSQVHDVTLDSPIHYQLDPLTNHSRDYLVKNVSRTTSPTNSSHSEPRPNISRGNNVSESHDQDDTLHVYNDWSSPPPTYSKTPEPQHDGKRTDDGHLLEAGLSGANDIRVNEVKDSLQTDKQIRMAFVRKVYFLLSTQLLCTILISVLFSANQTVSDYVQNHPVLFFVSWILSLGTLVLLFWQRKRYPLNIVLLFLFTLISSYSIGTIVSMYSAKVVIQSLIITFGVFLALQVFTLQSKYDFSSWGPFLYACLWALIIATVIGFIFPYERGYHIVISVAAALIFSAYIIYDTYMIFKRMNPEEYIVAVVELYLDILNIFALIMTLLGGACEASS